MSWSTVTWEPNCSKVRDLVSKFKNLKEYLTQNHLECSIYFSLVEKILSHDILGRKGVADCHLNKVHFIQKWIYRSRQNFICSLQEELWFKYWIYFILPCTIISDFWSGIHFYTNQIFLLCSFIFNKRIYQNERQTVAYILSNYYIYGLILRY